MSRSVSRYHLSTLIFCLVTSQAAAVSIRVPTTAPTIQSAVSMAATGDTIVLAPGTYTGSSNRNISMQDKQLVFLGEEGPENTIIDLINLSIPAFRMDSDDPAGTVFQGITIRHAQSGLFIDDATPLLTNMRFVDNHVGVFYIRWDQSDTTKRLQILNSEFVFNDTGIHAVSGSTALGKIATVAGCSFTGNNRGLTYYSIEPSPERCFEVHNSRFANNERAVASSDYVYFPELVFDSCQFDSNETALQNSVTVSNSTFFGGDVAAEGFLSSRIKISNSRFEQVRNVVLESNVWGRNHQSQPPSNFDPGFFLENCTIINNPGAIASLGGFIDEDPIGATFTGCSFQYNQGGITAVEGLHRLRFENCVYAHNGDGLEVRGSGTGLEIIGCTFADNIGSAVNSWLEDWSVNIERSIFYSNTGPGIRLSHFDYDSAWSISCCNFYNNNNGMGDYNGIPSQDGQNGNISTDPFFCNAPAGLYSIYGNSPCSPLLSSCGQLVGAVSVACAYMQLDSLTIDSLTDNQHVINQTPSIFWNGQDSLADVPTQAEVEVGSDTVWDVAELWNSEMLPVSDGSVPYAGAPLVDGQTYYVRARISNGQYWTEWKETTFRMNTAPFTPQPLSPSQVSISTFAPTLWVSNAADAEDDPLNYQFELFSDSGLTTMVTGMSVVQSPDSTGWVVDPELEENAYYWWRARAYDGYEGSGWTLSQPFWINNMPEVPAVPTTVYPPTPADFPVFDMQPIFRWLPVTDPDPFDTIYYTIEVSTDSLFDSSIVIDSLSQPQYASIDSLVFQTQYWWKVSAFDQNGLGTEAIAASSFWTWTLGDVNHNHTVTVSDVTTFVGFLFTGMDTIEPLFVGDMNGNCQVNIQDLTYLIGYLFRGGPQPKIGCD